VTRRQHLGVFLLFVVLVVLYSWPLMRRPMELPDNPDAHTMTWIMLAVFRNLFTQPATLLQGNAIYPWGNSLTFIEPLVVPALIAGPVFALTSNPALAHKIALVLLWALSGWAVPRGFLAPGDLGLVRDGDSGPRAGGGCAPVRGAPLGRDEDPGATELPEVVLGTGDDGPPRIGEAGRVRIAESIPRERAHEAALRADRAMVVYGCQRARRRSGPGGAAPSGAPIRSARIRSSARAVERARRLRIPVSRLARGLPST
jgi:hypothetical protein